MIKFIFVVALGLATIAYNPASAKVLAHTGNVHECGDKAFRYAGLVRYKDANIKKEDVITIIAPRLSLPLDWEKHIYAIVDEMYSEDLTSRQLFERIYTRCIYGYGQ